MKNILIIDDDRDFRFLLKHQLKELQFNCFECATRDEAFKIMTSEPVHLVLCDLNLKKESGKEVVTEMRTHFPEIPIIMITGYSNVRSAVELMRLGASDYLLKPLVPEELVFIMKKTMTDKTNREIVSDAPAKHISPATVAPVPRQFIFSDNESSRQIMQQIDLVAPTNFSVIIYGESGSGKEAYAQSIHSKSKRSKSPFLAIDCGALSSELSASILFGHEKGAFTGADAMKQGAFELAHGGTVFLDEITNLPYEIQVSLLRVMQERKTRRVGGTKDLPIDVRIIVASNIKLWDACRQGKFREDLYHRFNEFALSVKPLRERKDDILFYAAYFLNQSNAELEKSVRGFTAEAAERLTSYAWPGNVRELRNVVRRSVLITESHEIGVQCLPNELSSIVPASTGPDSGNHGVNFLRPLDEDYRKIVEALRKTFFNKNKASRLIGMDPRTMDAKIKEYSHEHGFQMDF